MENIWNGKRRGEGKVEPREEKRLGIYAPSYNVIRGMCTGEMILEKWALFVTPVGTSRNARDRKSLAIYFPGRGREEEEEEEEEEEGVLNT